ncbi:hypothetical protein TWF106_010372 [Orbilia oligospora]|nr:hypothetical protein TWF106_010372 [Orbilia oligospora]
MKVEHGKSMYRGSSHWALVLSEIAEVRNYFTVAANREKFECISKEQEREKLQTVNTCFPFSASSLLSRNEILRYLPTQSVADKLVEHWFDAFDRSYHILHGPTFRKEYEAFWQDPQSSKVDLSWIGLLMAILATTIADLMNLGRMANDPELMGMESDQYKLPIEHCIVLGLNAAKPGLYTIQAMIIYLGWARNKSNQEQMWLYLGLILRVAQSMGLHRDPKKFEVDIAPYHVEMRRRLWNVLSCMDLLESIRIGLPSIVRAGESDAMLPSNIHDYEFDEDSKTLPPSRPMSEHTPMSYMIAKSKLANVFGRAVQMINQIKPAPHYDDILRLDAEARKVYSSMPDFLKFRPLEESRVDHPALIMQRYGLNILHQKSLLIMHRPYFTLRLKNNARYAPSRRACLESAMTLLNHQYTSWDTQYNKKDKTLYHIDPISPSDYLPAAVIIMIEVWQASADLNTSNGGIFTMGRGDHEHMLKVLERACHIYSSFPDNLEVAKAHALLSHLIEKVKAKFYARNRPSDTTPTQSPPDNYSPFSGQPMSTTPEPSSAKDSEHSAALTLGMLSSGGVTPLTSPPSVFSGFTTAPAAVPLQDVGKTGLTPLYQPASPSGANSVPLSFFGQGMGIMGMDGPSSLGWDEWDNFIQGINSDNMNWNIPMSPPASNKESNSESSPQWASMIAPDPGSTKAFIYPSFKMLSLRRSIFRNLKPGAIYAAPPVLQQQRARAFQAVATLADNAVIAPRAPSPPLSRILPTAATQTRMYSSLPEQSPDHRDFQGNPLPPTKRIYVGNISYGIRGEDLEREFGEFGKVVSAKVVYDPRGLSKGFGYVEYEEQDAATAAVQKMHGLIVDGRRINVQYVLRPDREGPTNGESNAPSRTLFIGNLSFDITDKDLNELFAGVRNCTDVRVAIDRRTGQPRGFAHADFVDIASAEAAKSQLETKSIYGRQIRIDFTKTSPQRLPLGSTGRSFINPDKE